MDLWFSRSTWIMSMHINSFASHSSRVCLTLVLQTEGSVNPRYNVCFKLWCNRHLFPWGLSSLGKSEMRFVFNSVLDGYYCCYYWASIPSSGSGWENSANQRLGPVLWRIAAKCQSDFKMLHRDPGVQFWLFFSIIILSF